jgi:hypothetical protein
MPSYRTKSLNTIYKILGPVDLDIIYNLIYSNPKSNRSLGLSTNLKVIGNYTDTFLSGDYSLLTNKLLSDIISEWNLYLQKYLKSYSSENYTEHNKIILDNRINGVGFYWVDLQKQFCIESMIRMQDCGRVGYGKTTLELREQLSDSNISHMIVVYEFGIGNIRQVKGRGNSKPNKEYWIHYYNLIINSDYFINEYVPTYKPENDLLISDLELNLQSSIYIKYPNLIKTKYIL